MSRFWPVTLEADGIVLRPFHRKDARAYAEIRRANTAWLRPWEATVPGSDQGPPRFHEMRRMLADQGRRGHMLPFAVEVDGELRGQLTVGPFQWGSMLNATLGYWIDRRMAGRGITPTAVALATDHCWFALGVHRMEINIRPENTASLRVVEKLGFRDEGVRRNFMHIDGAWRDHRTFALTREDAPHGLLHGWLRELEHLRALHAEEDGEVDGTAAAGLLGGEDPEHWPDDPGTWALDTEETPDGVSGGIGGHGPESGPTRES
ncbi:GNAT family N-acetyltransferase [Brevibacterium litoralis]|uniref:GNAT family N-acetyltransferase n=1 Tax=Brevibacterium litoralis TaxID=3138935 RepID=UPI0032ED5E98